MFLISRPWSRHDPFPALLCVLTVVSGHSRCAAVCGSVFAMAGLGCEHNFD